MTRCDLADLIRSCGVANPEPLVRDAKPAARIVLSPCSEADLAVGASRFGGTPGLDGRFWPRTESGRWLPFIAQVNLAECGSMLDPADGWPLSGWLHFFCHLGRARTLCDMTDHDRFALRYTAAGRVLRQEAMPRSHVSLAPGAGAVGVGAGASGETSVPGRSGADISALVGPMPDVLPVASMSFEHIWTLPMDLSHLGRDETPDRETYARVLASLPWTRAPRPAHQIGGHPIEIQERVLFVSARQRLGFDPPPGHPARRECDHLALILRLVLQLDHDEALGFHPGADAGRLFVSASEHSIGDRSFEFSWALTQSS